MIDESKHEEIWIDENEQGVLDVTNQDGEELLCLYYSTKVDPFDDEPRCLMLDEIKHKGVDITMLGLSEQLQAKIIRAAMNAVDNINEAIN